MRLFLRNADPLRENNVPLKVLLSQSQSAIFHPSDACHIIKYNRLSSNTVDFGVAPPRNILPIQNDG